MDKSSKIIKKKTKTDSRFKKKTIQGKKGFNKTKGTKKDHNKYSNDSPSEGEDHFLGGDISEEDIDSDDDLSLDEEDLPTPPDTTTTEDESSEDDEEEEEIIDNVEKRTVFVGNLPLSINKYKLKKWFTKFGEVECVRLRCAPLSIPGLPKRLAVIKKAYHEERNSINGFVRFSTVEEAKNALTANGERFDEDHHIRVDMANMRGHHNKVYDDKKAIFIGNLHFGAEEDQLRDHFADCGDIVSIRIIRDKETAVGKGFAYINFSARHSVRLALEKNGLELNGRKLRLQKASYNQGNPEAQKVSKKNMKMKKSNNKFRSTKKVSVGKKDVVTNSQKNSVKKGKKPSDGRPSYQGVHSKKDTKLKKITKRKKKLKLKREVIKKILNNESKGNKTSKF